MDTWSHLYDVCNQHAESTPWEALLWMTSRSFLGTKEMTEWWRASSTLVKVPASMSGDLLLPVTPAQESLISSSYTQTQAYITYVQLKNKNILLGPAILQFWKWWCIKKHTLVPSCLNTDECENEKGWFPLRDPYIHIYLAMSGT